MQPSLRQHRKELLLRAHVDRLRHQLAIAIEDAGSKSMSVGSIDRNSGAAEGLLPTIYSVLSQFLCDLCDSLYANQRRITAFNYEALH